MDGQWEEFVEEKTDRGGRGGWDERCRLQLVQRFKSRIMALSPPVTVPVHYEIHERHVGDGSASCPKRGHDLGADQHIKVLRLDG